jgi:aspartate ammonia-lyase
MAPSPTRTRASGSREQARIEEDALGLIELPPDAPYGPETERARRNFPISGRCAPPSLIRALLRIKRATATANERCGALEPVIAERIRLAIQELLAPTGDDALHWRDLFPIDVFGAGAGTSLHMNVNEVVARRASLIRRHEPHAPPEPGKIRELRAPETGGASNRVGAPGATELIDPHDHVNLHQSSNDVFPSAIRIALVDEFAVLIDELGLLGNAIKARAFEAKDLRKTARTHLRDALPITLGRELHAWAVSLERCHSWIDAARRELLDLPLGGGAVGTALGIPIDYTRFALEELNRGRDASARFRTPRDPVEAVQSQGPVALASGMLRLLAIELGRIASDLRLLSSGPRAGLHELELPAVQPGSSAMPAKVNPSVAEMVNQVCFATLGKDLTVALAAGAGQLDLNVMTPVMALSAIEASRMLTQAARTLRVRCIDGLGFNELGMTEKYRSNAVALTALAPQLGFARTRELIREAEQQDEPILDWLRTKSNLPESVIDSFESELRRSLEWPFEENAPVRGTRVPPSMKRRP